MAENQSMQHFVIPCGDASFHLYCSAEDVPPSLSGAADGPGQLLKEAGGNWKNMTGPYRYRVDGPHDATTGQRHIHVYKKNNQLFALNWDGSGHDNSKGTEIPKKVHDYLGNAHPDLSLPKNRIIESIHTGGQILKFSEYVRLRLSDESAMDSLKEAIALLEEFMNRDSGGESHG